MAVLDRTVTSMGSRLMADWLNSPLTEIAGIDQRLDAVDELLSDHLLGRAVTCRVAGVYDMQRLLARGDHRPCESTRPGIHRQDAKEPSQDQGRPGRSPIRQVTKQLELDLDLCPELQERLERALVESCPLASREGGIIREGYDAKLDNLRELARGGKQWIAEYQQREIQQSGIPSLKVGYNRVFGYYLEVTNAHRDKIPENYIRKQTLKNAERYITPELKEYEEKVLSADEKGKDLEYELFLELRSWCIRWPGG